MAAGFALFSFGVLALGSLLNGARLFTAFIRGIESGVTFGVLAWLLCSFLFEETEGEGERKEGSSEDTESSDNEKKGQNFEHLA